MAIIDATNMVLGRLCAVIAKRAMIGEKIEIVNCEKAVVSGARKYSVDRYVNAYHRGTPFNGPYVPRQADRLVKRTIKGMIPYRKDHGDKALRRIKCYVGVPEKLQGQKLERIDDGHLSSSNIAKYVTLKDLTKLMGSKN